MKPSAALFTEIEQRCLEAETTVRISPERQAVLSQLGGFIAEKYHQGKTARINFICTHNSRRSFLGQVWMAVAAARYGLSHVRSYSGGTEATCLNPRIAESLKRFGFDVFVDRHAGNASNPHYSIRFGEHHSIVAYSKKFDQSPPNPVSDFAAVMVCTDADEACPFVPGCSLRLKLPFVDPKLSDGTDLEAATYDARSLEIAAHCLYAAKDAALRQNSVIRGPI
jgi:arsenate reductase